MSVISRSQPFVLTTQPVGQCPQDYHQLTESEQKRIEKELASRIDHKVDEIFLEMQEIRAKRRADLCTEQEAEQALDKCALRIAKVFEEAGLAIRVNESVRSLDGCTQSEIDRFAQMFADSEVRRYVYSRPEQKAEMHRMMLQLFLATKKFNDNSKEIDQLDQEIGEVRRSIEEDKRSIDASKKRIAQADTRIAQADDNIRMARVAVFLQILGVQRKLNAEQIQQVYGTYLSDDPISLQLEQSTQKKKFELKSMKGVIQFLSEAPMIKKCDFRRFGSQVSDIATLADYLSKPTTQVVAVAFINTISQESKTLLETAVNARKGALKISYFPET